MVAVEKKRVSQSTMDSAVEKLVKHFISDISSGRYSIGTIIPGPRETARNYGVSFSTARKLFTRLKEGGYISTIPRKGSVLTGKVTPASASGKDITKKGIIVVGALEYNNSSAVHNQISRALRVIENACNQNGILIQFYNLHKDLTRILRADETVEVTEEDIKYLNRSGASGCIVVNAYQMSNKKNMQMWKKLGIPGVFIGGEDPRTHRVLRDEKKSGSIAAEHLLKQGYEKIAFLGYHIAFEWQKERLEGIREVLAKQGLALIETWKEVFPYYDPHTLDRDVRLPLFREMAKILADCTAVICSSEALGKLILEYPAMNKITPPSIVTFDDAQNYRPWNMTSVRDPIEDMAADAFQLLLADIREGGGKKEKTFLVPGRLFERSTTRKQTVKHIKTA